MEMLKLNAPPAIAPADLLAIIVEALNSSHAQTMKTFGVGQGRGGLILINCHYAAFTGQSHYYDRAQEYLEQVLGQLDPHAYRSDFGSNYYQELAELGHLVGYLARHGHLAWDPEALLSTIDGILEQRLHHFLGHGNFERLNGALSAGTYFLRRAHASSTARCSLDALLDALQMLREGDTSTGYYWICRVIAEPRVYTGLSHGSAMIISFLTALHQTGHRTAECAELLHGAVKFLLRTRMDPDQFLSSFPLWRGKNELTPDLGLVYGDLGPAHALAQAALVLNRPDYLAEAVAVARRTTQRTSLATTYLHDASVFYGASGTYLLYAGLYRLTGEAEFAAAAAFWLAQIPARAMHGGPYLGFNSYFFSRSPPAQLGLNMGLTGIGLTLLQAISHGEYALDEFTWLS
ncbi:lanthionine synthetase LanC family protein [Hymenobacter coccineus]|uniref:Lanthionine synthetase n=1 Tax=Hymenobacter coccineus TaxID=1908235 RepID=A0A1G1TH21_9BACT|nr:lanthionine synthetase LanC family protein [Hymenobacter coccineus]OGX90172.1 hypothetical protein BEN49_07410 [Hymenobacter coccineus]